MKSARTVPNLEEAKEAPVPPSSPLSDKAMEYAPNITGSSGTVRESVASAKSD